MRTRPRGVSMTRGFELPAESGVLGGKVGRAGSASCLRSCVSSHLDWPGPSPGHAGDRVLQGAVGPATQVGTARATSLALPVCTHP